MADERKCADRRRAVALSWITNVSDGQEHAVLDRDNPIVPHPSAGAKSGLLALCERRVTERRASLLVPPGPRCQECVAGRMALQRAHVRRSGLGADLVDLLRRTARIVATRG